MNTNIRAFVDGLDVSKRIAGGDMMFAGQNDAHYFSVGRSALRVILSGLAAREEYANCAEPVASILDYGCGYGRVCRFLRAAFPGSDIFVGDVNLEAVEFCVDHFGCTAITGMPPAEGFDLIWVGSVFTHMVESAARDLLYTLVDALRPNGLLVFTTHGRFSYATHYCNPALERYVGGRIVNDRMNAEYLTTGYGYAAHFGQDELRSLVNPGVSIIDPHWVQRCLFPSTGILQVMFQERGWDYHQDVYGFVRSELTQEP